ncbi:Dfp1/Him1, central region-domain-containing protein [Epithele typhae]|uniref:Dfp1/Him1, central region-domain-containing protein n=1 Tax=Epithele typhae TaxID=378194 RepID=UPI002007FBEC|nr:Dfp1/Him1, central region-domain-containing protein [Epithele typhae]KAH9942302.1 Dfp1/Him1, central region-domain-containing protein [Epithele typhae]
MSISPCRTSYKKSSSALKRPLSPEPAAEDYDQSLKRAKTSTSRFVVVDESPLPAAAARAEVKRERERQKDKERMVREETFKAKYSRAFPSWTFYFDFDSNTPETAAIRSQLEKRKSEDFFSKDITHFITLHDIDDKENKEKSTTKRGASASASTSAAPGGLLGSPIKLRGRAPAGAGGDSLLDKARSFNMKIWSANKLHNILDRCDAPRGPSGTTGSLPSRHDPLATLLKSEQLHGTMERDPTQRRPDWTYFSKNTYFVLIEDLRQELATINATEYPITRTKDGREIGGWPVLHCHPLARGPFLLYDEREERRRVKAERSEKERIEDRARRKLRLQLHKRKAQQQLVRARALQTHQLHAQAQAHAQHQHDLRRSASLNNLRRRATAPDASAASKHPDIDLDDEFPDDEREGAQARDESVIASGYLASGAYMAASGNSVSLTSTTGTTSTGGTLLRSLQLPPGFKEKMQNQVPMKRLGSGVGPSVDRANKENSMGPPTTIPAQAKPLRKSKSTTTLKLPQRDEATKPGYCECCRLKFEDFREHVLTKKHRKFAADDNNFRRLDQCLARVRRRTVHEVRIANEHFLREAYDTDAEGEDVEGDSDSVLPQLAGTDEDVQWDEWLHAGKTEMEA